jgi:hypothetical protein
MSRDVDPVELNGRRLRALDAALKGLLRSARGGKRVHGFYLAGAFHGGKMRNLDDLVMHLEDARKEIKAYLNEKA